MDSGLAEPTVADNICRSFNIAAQLFEDLVQLEAANDVETYKHQRSIQHKLLLAWGTTVGIPAEAGAVLQLQVDVFRVPNIMAEMTEVLADTKMTLGEFDDAVSQKQGYPSSEIRPPVFRAGTEALTENLKTTQRLIEDLYGATGGEEKKTLQRAVAYRLRTMVIEENNVEQLQQMTNALAAISEASEEDSGMSAAFVSLGHLLQLKQIGHTSEAMIRSGSGCIQGTFQKYLTGVTTLPVLDDGDIQGIFNKVDDNEKTLYDPQRDKGCFPADSEHGAWIEWRTAEPNRGIDAYYEALLRSTALAHKLALPGPDGFSLPICIGFVRQDIQDQKCGWIFKLPPDVDNTTPFVTLNSMLRNNESNRKPTLNQKVAMARRLASLLRDLHSADWIHQAIHSGNIIFYVVDGVPRFDVPVLSGFEYSRPYRDTVEPRGLDEKWDIYRWSQIQGEVPRAGEGSKIHDIYSLGLILLEIAHWQPLNNLVNIKGWPRPSPPQSLRIRNWLLHANDFPPFRENPLEVLRISLGDAYWRATSRCLRAYGEEGMGIEAEATTMTEPSIGMALHAAFSGFVVEELDSIIV